ncbi:MAG: ribokinase [Rhodospirillales bacterium]|nr:ribokinase [Alphaproteobacteria bacterium]USO03592.1 MAG: ribokinase [Rhodospirillales bacterium]
MIVVFGSINMDLNIGVGKFPQPGETVLSLDYKTTPGGKGGNQALAAARTGEKTALVGRVGDDGMGLRILNNLRRNEVMTSGVSTSEILPTGLAFVMRDRNGENEIVVASGANAEVSAEQVPDEILKAGNVVLMQMEIPVAENIALMERAKEFGATVILNVAPALKLPKSALSYVDYLIVNQIEARQMAESYGFNLDSDKDADRIAETLAKFGKLTCILTRGPRGTIVVTQDGRAWLVPALELEKVVDTTGAGDCFCGTLAAMIYKGTSLLEGIKRANVAAGLSCLKVGIQEAYPYSAEIDEYLPSLPEAKSIKFPSPGAGSMKP